MTNTITVFVVLILHLLHVKNTHQQQKDPKNLLDLQSFFHLKTSFPLETSSWHSAVIMSLWTHSPTSHFLWSLHVCPRFTGSTAAPRPQPVKGTIAWPLWRICCSRCEKSTPSSLWRRRRSCPTRQSWTPRHSAGPPVLSGASPLCPCTSSPESSSYTCWEGRKRNIRWMPCSQTRPWFWVELKPTTLRAV